MRKFWLHIALSCLCLTCLAGCGNSGYDRRLVAADSLLTLSADSARAVLRAIDADRLSRADRAYHALLSTQAAYKCFDSIPSTATIDRAVDYFSSGSDREKLTRSLLYKGAVLSELNRKTEAMEFYKQAEEAASPTDYANLGYINLRMASLYHESYAENEIDIDKYKKAYKYYKIIDDSVYQLKCLNNIGLIYRTCNIDSAYYYIYKAINLAKALNDKKCIFSNYLLLVGVYYTDSLYLEQKNVALNILNNGLNYVNPNNLYNYLSRAYAMIGKHDSARIFLNKVVVNNDVEKISYLITKRDIEKSCGNYQLAMAYDCAGDSLAKIIEDNSPRKQLSNIEQDFDDVTNHKKDSIINSIRTALVVLLIIMLIVTFGLTAIIIKNKKRLKNVISKLEEMRIQASEKEQQSFSIFIEQLGNFIEINSKYGTRLDKFYEKFMGVMNMQRKSRGISQIIRNYVDTRNIGIVRRLSLDFPKLTESDIDVICMLLCGLDTSTISFLMGFIHPKSIYRRKKLILEKMSMEFDSLDDFLTDYTNISA